MSSFDRDFGGHNFEPVEKTVLLDDMAAQLLERRPPGDPELANEYRILVVDPAGQEWEYPIRGEVLLGRSEENQIMIEDRAVSRHHLAINTDGKLFWFQDLNSGNGTQLNGEYVQEGWLTGGEEIIIGNSRIYFLIPGSATDNAEPQADDLPMDPGSLVATPVQDAASLVATPSPASPAAAPEAEEDDEGGKWLALALVVFVLGLGVAGLGAWFLYKRLGAGKKPTVIGQTSARSSLKKLQHGNKLIQEGKFTEASRFFRMAASSVPESNSYRSTFLERANIAGIEALAKKYYNEAKKLYYEEDKACDAYGSLKKVSKRSSLFRKADKLRKRIFNKDIKRSLRMIDLMIASNNPIERKKARKKLQELQYCDTDLPGIKQRLTKLNQPHTPTTPNVPDAASTRTPSPPPRRRTYRRPSYRRPKVRRSSGTISQGVSLFCKGQYAASIVHFSRIIGSSSGSKRRKARRYRSAVKTFKRYINSGSAYGLLKAHRAARKISNCNLSKYKGRLAKAFINEAKRNEGRSRYAAAYRSYRKALRYNSGSSTAKSGLRRIKKKATKLYGQAEVLMDVDPNEAKKFLRQVISILPPSDPIYRKAKSKL